MAKQSPQPIDWVEYNRALARSLRQKIEEQKLTRKPTQKNGRS